MSDHEIRIALVLNGGVSLAVWMGGVTHELDLIRRASGAAGAPKAQSYDAMLPSGSLEADPFNEASARSLLTVKLAVGGSLGGACVAAL